MGKSGNSTKATAPVVYNWSVPEYIRLVENTQNPTLKEFEQVELDYLLNKIANPQNKTFIDVGAGYGRVLPYIAAPITRNVIAVEINDNMFSELQKRARRHPNVIAIKGDANNLSNVLAGTDIVSPIIACLQNSLGTWEGDYQKALSEMGKVAKEKKGEVIISAWRGERFKEYAMDVYSAISGVVGVPDPEQSDFKNGIFRSKTGYISKWWSPSQREEMIRIIGGRKVKEVLGSTFFILHVSYT